MKKIIKFAFILTFISYIIFPIITNLILSFSTVWQWPDILPNHLTFIHYQKVLNQRNFWRGFSNTIFIGLMVMLLNYLLALPSAYALSRLKSKYKPLLITLIILPIIVPPVLVLLNLYNHFLIWNLTNRKIGVIIAHMIPSLPYMFIMLYLGFEKIDMDYERIYLSLGIKPFNGFIRIILPQMREAIILGGIMTFLISISQYLSTLLIGGGSVITLTLLLTPYINGGNTRVGAAQGVLLIIICLLFIRIYEFVLLGGKNARNS